MRGDGRREIQNEAKGTCRPVSVVSVDVLLCFWVKCTSSSLLISAVLRGQSSMLSAGLGRLVCCVWQRLLASTLQAKIRQIHKIRCSSALLRHNPSFLKTCYLSQKMLKMCWWCMHFKPPIECEQSAESLISTSDCWQRSTEKQLHTEVLNFFSKYIKSFDCCLTTSRGPIE